MVLVVNILEDFNLTIEMLTKILYLLNNHDFNYL
jgi:hypothetical protein